MWCWGLEGVDRIELPVCRGYDNVGKRKDGVGRSDGGMD